MDGEKLEFLRIESPQGRKKREQCQRILSARKSDADTVVFPDHVIFVDGAPHRTQTAARVTEGEFWFFCFFFKVMRQKFVLVHNFSLSFRLYQQYSAS